MDQLYACPTPEANQQLSRGKGSHAPPAPNPGQPAGDGSVCLKSLETFPCHSLAES